ncbi:MAG: cache domain-containing protein [Anaerolineae bacterium]|nr:cache domain-containing protein [Anaerolineae bacterium]MBT7324722.1 cache domain-containing protein [Anaerolineae bacterium]
MKQNLRLRFQLIFIGLAIGPMLFASIFIGPYGFSSLEEQSRIAQHDLAAHISLEINGYFEERINELLLLDQIYALGGRTSEEQRDILNIFLLKQRVYQEMILLDIEGQEEIRLSRDSTFNQSELKSRAEKDEFLYPLGKKDIYFSQVYFDEALGESLITVSIPLFDRNTGRVLSILVADIRFKAIWDLLSELGFKS